MCSKRAHTVNLWWRTEGALGETKRLKENYFVCPSTRCHFWLRHLDTDSIIVDLCGVRTEPSSERGPRVHSVDLAGKSEDFGRCNACQHAQEQPSVRST
jgi:hypothetical protein